MKILLWEVFIKSINCKINFYQLHLSCWQHSNRPVLKLSNLYWNIHKKKTIFLSKYCSLHKILGILCNCRNLGKCSLFNIFQYARRYLSGGCFISSLYSHRVFHWLQTQFGFVKKLRCENFSILPALGRENFWIFTWALIQRGSLKDAWQLLLLQDIQQIMKHIIR